MNQNVIVVFWHGDEQIAICVGPCTKFSELLETCRVRWKDLMEGSFSFRYSLGILDNCLLDSDGDLVAMLCLAQQSEVKMVEVKIKGSTMDSLRPSKDNVADITHSNSNDTRSPLSDRNHLQEPVNDFNGIITNLFKATGQKKRKLRVNKVYEDDGEMPEYDICPRLIKRQLLSSHWEHIISGVEQRFLGGAEEFREKLIQYATFHGFQFNFQQNQNHRIYVVCGEFSSKNACKWFIRANSDKEHPGVVVIKSAELNHSCESSLTNTDTSRFGKKLIAKMIQEHVRTTPTFSASDVLALLQAGYGIRICYHKCWEALDLVRNNIFGAFDESFDHLQWYCIAITKTNPGSHVVIEANKQTKRFEKAFIAFKACMDGFKFCRPLLYIDGTFMTARWNGTVLAATAKDGSNGIFPVAIAIVQSETTANWKWFLEQVRDNIKHDQRILFMSDRNAGLLSAFNHVYPNQSVNFYCLVHLFGNLKGQYGPGFKDGHRINMCSLLKKCAYAPTKHHFAIALDNFKKVGGAIGAKWIATIEPEKWAVSHAPTIMRYGEVTSNAAESFNNWIREARSLPVTYMVDCIRVGIMRWFVERRAAADNWGSILTNTYQKKWNDYTYMAKSYGVLKCPDGRYEVRSIPRVEVDMGAKTCTCHHWQVDGFPCAHAVAVIRHSIHSVEGLIDHQFYTASYKKAYQADLHAVPETAKFECQALVTDKILAPERTIKVGRPREKRFPSFGEIPKRKPWRCPCCNKMGNHDPITCKDYHAGDLS